MREIERKYKNNRNLNTSTKLILAGPPGSGKSTFAVTMLELGKMFGSFSMQAVEIDGVHFLMNHKNLKFIEYQGVEAPVSQLRGSPMSSDLKSLIKNGSG
ncbi:MAG: hypothetical protein HOA75_12310 [Deltaproteobacteria bacterium]|nr:hypothetical protein [Deltaproteobacteria bacterium]